MKTHVCKAFFLLLAFLVPNALAGSEVKFRLVQKFMIVVSVRVNDAEQFDFLLDTGTNSSVITPEAAQKLDLHPRDRIEMITVAGNQIVPRSFLPIATLGSISAKETEVLIADLPAIRAIDRNISGILGQNFLEQFNYLIDFKKKRIFFDENGDLENSLSGKEIRFEMEQSRLLVTVLAEQSTFRLALDSGASNTILFRRATQQMKQDKTYFAVISTNAGSKSIETFLLSHLRIGDETFYDLTAVLISDENHDTTSDGLLPLCLFNSVYFNNKKNYAVFNPRVSKQEAQKF